MAMGNYASVLESRKHMLEQRTEKENGKIIKKLERKIRKIKGE